MTPAFVCAPPAAAALSYPNSSLSSSVSPREAQWTVTIGAAARRDRACSVLAMTSLPTPLSPRMRTSISSSAIRSSTGRRSRGSVVRAEAPAGRRGAAGRATCGRPRAARRVPGSLRALAPPPAACRSEAPDKRLRPSTRRCPSARSTCASVSSREPLPSDRRTRDLCRGCPVLARLDCEDHVDDRVIAARVGHVEQAPSPPIRASVRRRRVRR